MSKHADVTLVGPHQELRSFELGMEPAGICSLNHHRYTDLTWCIAAHGHFRPCDAMVTMWYDGITCFIQANTGYTVKVNNINGMNSKINISNEDAIQINDCLNVSGQTNLHVTILYGKEQMTSTTTHGDVSARGNYMNTRSDNLEIDHNSTQQGTHMKGVFNLGMTCYANGIFQILAQTKRFLKTSIAPDMDRQPLTYFLERVLKDINQPGREKLYMTANKADVKKVLDIISQKSSFSRYRQHDCSELLMYILQRLKTENVGNTWMFEMKLQTVIEHKETKYDILHEDVCDTQLSFHLLVPLHRENHKMNPTVAGGVKKMLEDVESFTGEELPCRYCDMTNHAKNRMLKRLIVSKAPQILIIQIGRVENIDFEAKNYLRKQNILVEYEHSLSIAEVHWDESEKKMEEHYSYQLYGVVLHSGNIDCGHYYSYVKYQSSSEWFYCNDSSVTPIDENMVLNHEDAYLLFYDKKH